MFEANLLSVPVITLGLTFQNSLGSCSFQTKLKYRKDSCGVSNTLQALTGLQSAALVHSQSTENKDSVGLGSSAITVLLYKPDPIEQNPLLIRDSHCIPANLTKVHIWMHRISQAISLLVFVIITYCMNFFPAILLPVPGRILGFHKGRFPVVWSDLYRYQFRVISLVSLKTKQRTW